MKNQIAGTANACRQCGDRSESIRNPIILFQSDLQKGNLTMKTDVFISYHTSSSKLIVEKIVDVLEGSGISCWYAPRNCSGDFSESITEAIENCRIFLFVLNQYSNNSEHCKNEVSEAFERFSAHDGIHLLPVRTDQCVLGRSLHYFLGRIHTMDGGTPPDDLRLEELLYRVMNLLDARPAAEAEIRDENDPSKAHVYKLRTSLVYPDTSFVGRTEEIRTILEQLKQVDNKIFLYGMGGIGKSEIAKMALKQCASSYDTVMWIPFDTSLADTLANDSLFPVEGISRTQYANEPDEEYAKRKMDILHRIAGRNVLFVIDNFDTEDDPDLTDLISGEYAVIFTTRVRHSCGIRELEVTAMQDPEELLSLFKAEYKRPLNTADEADVKEIIRLLEGHTMSIRLVASSMKTRRIRPVQMKEMLAEDRPGIRDSEKLSALILDSMRRVFEIAALNEEELHIMKNLSLLPSSGLEVETFAEWCQSDDYETIDSLIERCWIMHDAVTDRIHVHPLIAELLNEEVRKDPQCCMTMLKNMINKDGTVRGSSLEWKMRFQEITGTVYARLDETHPMKEYMLQEKMRGLVSMQMYREAEEGLLKLAHGSGTLENRLFGYSRLAHGRILEKRTEEGIAFAKEGYALIMDLPSDQLTEAEGQLKQQLLARIYEAYNQTGDYENALKYEEEAGKNIQRFYVISPQYSEGWLKFHTSKTLWNMKEYEKGEQMIRSSAQLFKETGNDWARVIANMILGMYLAHRGEAEEALRLNDETSQVLLGMNGPEHPDVAKVYLERAQILASLNRFEEAENCLTQAERIYKKRGLQHFLDYIENTRKEYQTGSYTIRMIS